MSENQMKSALDALVYKLAKTEPDQILQTEEGGEVRFYRGPGLTMGVYDAFILYSPNGKWHGEDIRWMHHEADNERELQLHFEWASEFPSDAHWNCTDSVGREWRASA